METRIRELREDKDITQAAMGKHLGISQRSYAYYEGGQRAVPLEVLIAIADVHQVSVDYILRRTNNPAMHK